MQTPTIIEPLSDVFLDNLGKTVLLILGAPTSGKSDLRKRFEHEKIGYFESSEQIREFAKGHSREDLIEKMRKGDLVDLPDMESICNIVAQKTVLGFNQGIPIRIFVGFGRRKQELDFLVCRLRSMFKNFSMKVICLEVSEKVAAFRCDEREEEREDKEHILKRHSEWRQEKTSIISYLEKRQLDFRIIDTSALTKDQVYFETLKLLGAFE